jgi:hypothetical protein
MMKTMLKALRVNHDGYQKGPKMGPNISPVVGGTCISQLMTMTLMKGILFFYYLHRQL